MLYIKEINSSEQLKRWEIESKAIDVHRANELVFLSMRFDIYVLVFSERIVIRVYQMSNLPNGNVIAGITLDAFIEKPVFTLTEMINAALPN